jgi:hypothetical protein
LDVNVTSTRNKKFTGNFNLRQGGEEKKPGNHTYGRGNIIKVNVKGKLMLVRTMFL